MLLQQLQRDMELFAPRVTDLPLQQNETVTAYIVNLHNHTRANETETEAKYSFFFFVVFCKSFVGHDQGGCGNLNVRACMSRLGATSFPAMEMSCVDVTISPGQRAHQAEAQRKLVESGTIDSAIR